MKNFGSDLNVSSRLSHQLRISVCLFSVLTLHEIRLLSHHYHFNNSFYWLFDPCSGSKMKAGWGRAKPPVLPTPPHTRGQYHGDLMPEAIRLFQTGNCAFLKCSCYGNSRVPGFLFSEGRERLSGSVGARGVTLTCAALCCF